MNYICDIIYYIFVFYILSIFYYIIYILFQIFYIILYIIYYIYNKLFRIYYIWYYIYNIYLYYIIYYVFITIFDIMTREDIIYGRLGNSEMFPKKIIILEVISEFHLIFMNIDERGSDDGKREGRREKYGRQRREAGKWRLEDGNIDRKGKWMVKDEGFRMEDGRWRRKKTYGIRKKILLNL